MWHRTINWRAVIAWTAVVAAVVLVARNPQILSPLATKVLERVLISGRAGRLQVREYKPRFFEGVDLYGVSLSLPGDGGALTLVAADTLELDFKPREVLGGSVRLRRAELRGVEVYQTRGENGGGKTNAGGALRLPRLPRLRVDSLWITRGRVQVVTADGQLAEEIPALAWRGEVVSDGRTLTVTTRDGAVRWDSRGARLEALHGTAVVDSTGIRVDGLDGVLNGYPVWVRGSRTRTGDLDVEVSAEHLTAAEVDSLTHLHLRLAAEGALTAHIQVAAQTVRFSGTFSGQLAAWTLTDAEGEGVVIDNEIRFSRIQGRVAAAWFSGTLLVSRDPQGGSRVDIEGDAADVDISQGLVPGVAKLPPTRGHGRLRILHRTQDRSTLVSGQFTEGEIAIMPFDTCWFEVWATDDSLAFRRVDLHRGSIAATFAGTSDRNHVFTGSLGVRVGDVADLPPTWGLPPLQGSVEGRGTLRGPLDHLDFDGRYEFQNLAVGPLAFRTGDASLRARNVLGEDWSVNTSIDGEGCGLGGVDLGRYSLWGGSTNREAVIDSFYASRGDTLIALSGRAALAGGTAQITDAGLRIDFAGNSWRTQEPVEATVSRRRLHIPELRLVSEQGALTGNLDYVADSLLAGQVELSRVDMGLLAPFVPEAARVGGAITARARLGGSPSHPLVDLQGTLAGARFRLARVDSLNLRGEYRDGLFTLADLYLDSEFGLIHGQGSVEHRGVPLKEFWRGANLDLDLSITDGDWAFMEQFKLPALDRLSGNVEGRVKVAGSTDAPQVDGQLTSTPLNIYWLHLDELTGSIHADASQLVLGDLRGHQDQLRLEGRLEIPLKLDFLSTPKSPPDGPFYGKIVLPPGSDLGPVAAATNGFIETSGTGEGEIVVAGPLSHPLYSGVLTVHDGGFVVRDTEEVFSGVSLRGRFDGDVLRLENIEGREGLRGKVSGTGTVTFDGLKMTGFDVHLAVDRFLLASVPDLRALLRSSNARISSVRVGPNNLLVPKFSGDFELLRGRYTGIFAAEPNAEDPTVATVAPAWLADVQIAGPSRSARILNRNMELDISGDMTVVRDESGMYMRGSMDIDSGTLPVYNNTFKVVRGRLDFSREVGIIPQVDLDAETQIRLRQPDGTSILERITVHAGGSLDAPEITYSSESGYPRESIERMLVGLAPYPDEQADQGALASASLGAGLNLVEREIAGEIGFFDTLDLEQIKRQEAGTVGFDPLIGFGKYFWSALYVKYAMGFNQDDRDLLVEYQITNHLLLQTEIRRRVDEYQGDATYNVDLKYRFEY